MFKSCKLKRAKPLPRTRAKPRRKRPELFAKPERSKFLDPRSYVTKGGRVRLFGKDYKELRRLAWLRAKGQCECGCGRYACWFPFMGGAEAMGELSHNEHGPRKSDELARVKWMRHECHTKMHNAGGKPCPSKKSL